jgi:Na+/H+-dicarboxylate symporter
MLDLNVLGVITYSVLLGIVLLKLGVKKGKKGRPLFLLFQSINDAVMHIGEQEG